MKQEGKQLRVWINDETYNNLKSLSENSKIRINLLCGLILSGYQITKKEIKIGGQ